MEGQGTELNIYKMLMRLHKLDKLNKKDILWVFFVDFSKAYDVVNHKILYKKMEKLQISQTVIQGVKMLFNNIVIDSGKELLHIGRGLG